MISLFFIHCFRSAGGVLLSALEERIKCSNTLESRLELLSEKVKSF